MAFVFRIAVTGAGGGPCMLIMETLWMAGAPGVKPEPPVTEKTPKQKKKASKVCQDLGHSGMMFDHYYWLLSNLPHTTPLFKTT